MSFSNQSFSAPEWAAEFVRLHGGDEGLMLAWFANALMAGYDEAQRRAEGQREGSGQP